jgi:hypothetical protein
MRDHLLGWPAALDLIDAPTEARVERRTPLRSRRSPEQEAKDRDLDRFANQDMTCDLVLKNAGVVMTGGGWLCDIDLGEAVIDPGSPIHFEPLTLEIPLEEWASLPKEWFSVEIVFAGSGGK